MSRDSRPITKEQMMNTYEYFGCIAYENREECDYVLRTRIEAVNPEVAEVMALEVEAARLRQAYKIDGNYKPFWQAVTIIEVKADTPVASPMLFDVSQI